MVELLEKSALLSSYPQNIDKAIGITTTVPIEIIYAAGYFPVDLNNVFISSDDPSGMVDHAELNGIPRNTCAWIKGIYSAAKKIGIKKLIGVAQGDCTNTHAIMDIFDFAGMDVIPFEYPYKRDENRLKCYLREFADQLGACHDDVAGMKVKLDSIRALIHRIDELTWLEDKVTGEENHLWLVTASDMFGDYITYENDARDFLNKAEERAVVQHRIRLGFMGIPPICNDIFSFLGSIGCHVVFNEVQRQFSMPFETSTLEEQYTEYTYPYDIFMQIEDIKREISKRRIDGIVFYVQNFCHRSIYEKIIRKLINIPLITVDFDRPGPINGAMRTRLEAFIEMVENK